MIDGGLSADTRAVLLLCGSLGQRGVTDMKPLGPRQFHALATWLEKETMRPEDLLTPEGRSRLEQAGMDDLAPDRITPLLERGGAVAFISERWQRAGIWVLSRADRGYPDKLNRYLAAAAPPLLFGIGEPKSLNKGGLAVVGSRDRSEGDGAYARRIGEQCAREGMAVISGAAKGIDRDAMGGALDGGGIVVGVLAEGVAKYSVSAELREPIADGRLTLVSCYEPEARWFTWTAMERNKLMYGLSDAALVVTCGEESGGTWAGATEALKVGRVRVFVRTGDSVGPGNARLLKMGALPFPAEPPALLSDALEVSEASTVTGEAIESADDGLAGVSHEMSPGVDPVPGGISAVVEKATASIPAPDAAEAIRDAYSLVLPELLRALGTPCEEKKLVEMFQVRGPQMKDWLERARLEGRIEKLKKPARWALQGYVPEPPKRKSMPLFED